MIHTGRINRAVGFSSIDQAGWGFGNLRHIGIPRICRNFNFVSSKSMTINRFVPSYRVLLFFNPVLTALLLASAPAYAQQTSATPAKTSAGPTDTPMTTLKAETREVVLPVTVRDKKGQVIPSLKMEDFTLEQDGRPQKIKSFSHETNLPFRLGLLVDTSRSEENALPSEKTASGKFIDQMLAQPTDKAFLLHFDHEVELMQDFTGTKSKLHHELDDLQTSTSSGGGNTSGGGGGGHQGGRNGSGNGNGSDPNGDGQRGGDDDGHEGRHRGGGTQLYDAIYLASNELMLKEPGRKALVVLSDGEDRGSKDTLSDAVDAAEKANVSVYTVYFKGAEGLGNSGGMGHGGGGGGFPGHGSRFPRPGSGETHTDGKKILEQIARRTGGIAFEAKKKDSFDEVYAQIAEELRGQYLLTYTPDKPTDKGDSEGFHKIVLKAKDDKYIVVTREGYYSED